MHKSLPLLSKLSIPQQVAERLCGATLAIQHFAFINLLYLILTRLCIGVIYFLLSPHIQFLRQCYPLKFLCFNFLIIWSPLKENPLLTNIYQLTGINI